MKKTIEISRNPTIIYKHLDAKGEEEGFYFGKEKAKQ
jgi:hypothetical protein